MPTSATTRRWRGLPQRSSTHWAEDWKHSFHSRDQRERHPGATDGVARNSRRPSCLRCRWCGGWPGSSGGMPQWGWRRSPETNGRDLAVASGHALALPCRPARSAIVCQSRTAQEKRLRRSAAPGPRCSRGKSANRRTRRGAGAPHRHDRGSPQIDEPLGGPALNPVGVGQPRQATVDPPVSLNQLAGMSVNFIESQVPWSPSNWMPASSIS